LVEGDHSIAVAVVAANTATAAKAEIIRRFMGIPPSNAPLYIDPASLLSKVDRSRTLWRLFFCGSVAKSDRHHTRGSPLTQPGRERRIGGQLVGAEDIGGNDAFHRELKVLGAAEIRGRLATKVYLRAEAALATAWLERRSKASSSEQLDIARSAKDAAWAAARAADTANSKATIAIVIAAISLIVAIVLGVIPILLKH